MEKKILDFNTIKKEINDDFNGLSYTRKKEFLEKLIEIKEKEQNTLFFSILGILLLLVLFFITNSQMNESADPINILLFVCFLFLSVFIFLTLKKSTCYQVVSGLDYRIFRKLLENNLKEMENNFYKKLDVKDYKKLSDQFYIKLTTEYDLPKDMVEILTEHLDKILEDFVFPN